MRSLMLAVMSLSAVALAQPGGPPPEALAACGGLSAGAACGFTHRGQNLTGTCRAGPNGEALACAPHLGRGPGGGGPGPRTPPAEAVAACTGQSNGASCSFSLGDRALTGVCKAPPDGSSATLACAPPHPHHRGPPTEALAACSGQSEGASCSFSLEARALTGTCRAPHDGSSTTLACAPPHHHRGPPPEALAACASSSAGSSCSVTFQGQTLSGTCVAGPDGQALACLPPR